MRAQRQQADPGGPCPALYLLAMARARSQRPEVLSSFDCMRSRLWELASRVARQKSRLWLGLGERRHPPSCAKVFDASCMLCTKAVEAGGLHFSAEVQKFATEERTVGTLRHLAAEGPPSRGGSQRPLQVAGIQTKCARCAAWRSQDKTGNFVAPPALSRGGSQGAARCGRSLCRCAQ